MCFSPYLSVSVCLCRSLSVCLPPSISLSSCLLGLSVCLFCLLLFFYPLADEKNTTIPHFHTPRYELNKKTGMVSRHPLATPGVFYCSNFGPKKPGTQEGHARSEKKPAGRKQLSGTCFVCDLQQHDKTGCGWEKEIILPAHRGARDTPTTDISFLIVCFLVFLTPEEVLSATRCRID